ncbi:hypothetical protein ACP26L_23355 [Paenibacillus sp. S-38]|uniref:hypothetical protein n=1 Tax=Paenibacillus sp. S-38 TaxID=3416710 RepID=UPI003CF12133
MASSPHPGDKDFSARFEKLKGPRMSRRMCIFHFFLVLFLLVVTLGFGAFFVSYAGLFGVVPSLIPAALLVTAIVSWIRSY